MAILSYNDLSDLRDKHLNKKIVFCSGTFDLTHAGHVLFFEDCKALGDILVVAVGPDKDIVSNKGGGRPILNEVARLKMIDSIKPVDFALISNPTLPGAHWLSPLEEILSLLKPDVWVINSDGGDMEYRRKIASSCGVELVVLERTSPIEYQGISTTSIIKKVRALDQ